MAQQIAAISLALPSPSSGTDRPSPKPVNPKTIEMIGDLGLRYPPSTKQDEAGRAGLLRFLAEDVAHIHPAALELAIREWARTKAFLPKASELIALADKATRDRQRAATPATGETAADRANARLAARGEPPMWEMRQYGDEWRCEFVGPPREERPAKPLSRAELAAWSQAPAGSMRAAYFDWGRRQGWILPDGDGWRDSAVAPLFDQ